VALIALVFALEFNTKYYLGWEFDAGTRQAVNTIRSRHQANLQEHIGASWATIDSFNFYRAMYGLNWLAQATRGAPQCYYDYFYQADSDTPSLKRFAVKTVFRDPSPAWRCPCRARP